MGADLLIECVIIPEGNVDKLKQSMLKKVEGITEKDMKAVQGYFLEVQGDETDESLKDVKETFRGVVEEFFACLNHRDVTWIAHKGDSIFLTGGMTWGDAPSDSYDFFNRFNILRESI